MTRRVTEVFITGYFTVIRGVIGKLKTLDTEEQRKREVRSQRGTEISIDFEELLDFVYQVKEAIGLQR
jgi:pantothenate kinase